MNGQVVVAGHAAEPPGARRAALRAHREGERDQGRRLLAAGWGLAVGDCAQLADRGKLVAALGAHAFAVAVARLLADRGPARGFVAGLFGSARLLDHDLLRGYRNLAVIVDDDQVASGREGLREQALE